MKITHKQIVVLVFAMLFLSSVTSSRVALAAEGLKELKTGESAPEFQLADSHGKKHKLSQYKGKVVVLEWLNHGCPYVQKFYDAGKMQELQETYTKKGVVWLSVNSGAPGKQGTTTPADKEQKAHNSRASAVLLDSTGDVGRSYGARTTPHMYVVARDGKLMYQGAMDDQPTPDASSIKNAKNYVVAALEPVLAEKDSAVALKKIEKNTTEPYGCSVKYSK